MASKLCDSCKTATATVYCRADSAFLCSGCDAEVHAANKLASRHARVWVCEVCEQAPAHVTCKADAAALCVACDRDIHSANPLARRHERVPVTPFYDPVAASSTSPPLKAVPASIFLVEDNSFSDEEEAEAASWLLPNPNNANAFMSNKIADVFGEMEPYMDLGYVDPKQEEEESQEQNSSGTDGVVPVQNHMVPDHGCFEMDLPSKNGAVLSYGTCVSHHSVSLSSAEVGVVPEGEMSNNYGGQAAPPTVPLSAVDREARVMRYREKRKSRKFEKTIRYASRKAYAETRPRIKGRFAKRVDLDIDLDRPGMFGFGVVPSY